ncbi:MAG: sulfite exporter TauE/SafE family protein [Myxococcota bacterium]|jgi:uncharacterized membrane protein YfcA|nr:sulfite exporter TauE/SafE family protein [Myxococcota bacterium]
MLTTIGLVLLGLLAGVLGGLIGIGGGVIIVPILVFVFKYEQHLAQGTTLALLLPPIGILAAWSYYQQGQMDVRAAVLICLGFVVGGFFGAKLALVMPQEILRKVFGVAMLLIALNMIFRK